ncbi:undecaprenyl/decaprenyl-phosphate alpha-N-acetylglucosaminyl 1-phosphate transferase [Pelagibacterales bacterium]|nr:undecaprenyl/decaprenyl-phosphate alpha-N-acetylglucosaminyl 1-phosphate transferase [Pelagibacterales bacterium]
MFIYAIYFLLSFILFYIFASLSYKFDLVDLPSKRKLHPNPTAYTGGVILSLIFLASIPLFGLSNNIFSFIISLGFLVSLIGFIDDKYDLNVGGKLSLQIFPIFYLIVFHGLNLTQLGNYGYFEIQIISFSLPLTLICVLFLINAFNYFDGIDGTVSFTSISVLSILHFLASQELDILFIIIAIPICIFLCFNLSLFKLPKLFLGDSGSLLLGFIISFILIYLANQNIVHPILLAWSIVIFVYEFISIHFTRLINDQHPFQPGRDHLHDILFERSKSVFLTNLFISLGNLILFSIGYMSFVLINSLASLVLFIFLFIIFFYLRNLMTRS